MEIVKLKEGLYTIRECCDRTKYVYASIKGDSWLERWDKEIFKRCCTENIEVIKSLYNRLLDRNGKPVLQYSGKEPLTIVQFNNKSYAIRNCSSANIYLYKDLKETNWNKWTTIANEDFANSCCTLDYDLIKKAYDELVHLQESLYGFPVEVEL